MVARARSAAALIAEYRLVLTSRNGLLRLRRSIATRWPDLIEVTAAAARTRSSPAVTGSSPTASCGVRAFPERRWVHAVRLACGIWVGEPPRFGSGQGRAAGTATPPQARRSNGRPESRWCWAATSTSVRRGSTGWSGSRSVTSITSSSAQASSPTVKPRCSSAARCLTTHRSRSTRRREPAASAPIHQRARSPKPRSTSSAFSPSVPRAGSTPSWVAAS